MFQSAEVAAWKGEHKTYLTTALLFRALTDIYLFEARILPFTPSKTC